MHLKQIGGLLLLIMQLAFASQLSIHAFFSHTDILCDTSEANDSSQDSCDICHIMLHGTTFDGLPSEHNFDATFDVFDSDLIIADYVAELKGLQLSSSLLRGPPIQNI